MNESLNQLMERLLSGTELTRQEILWGALVVALGTSVVQLLVMIGTRWGNRNPSSKALLFSLLIHLSTGLGVVVTHPGFEGLPLVSQEPAPPEVQLEELTLMDEVPRPSTKSGTTPFWQKLPDFKPLEMARVDRPHSEFKPLEMQERERPEELTSVPPLPRMTELPPREQATPEPVFQGDPVPVTASPEARPLDSTEPQSQESPSRQTERKRFAVAQNSTPFDTDLDREPQRGNFDTVQPQTRPDQRLAALSLPNSEDPDAFLRRDEDTAALQPRTGPELNALPDPAPGLEATPTEPVVETGNEPPGRFNRITRRTSPQNSSSELLESGLERSRPGELPVSDGQLAMTTPGLPELEPFAPSPELARVEESGGPGPTESVPQLYQLRDAEVRKQVTAQNGGTAESEKAVENSLKWLASVQEPAGFWDASRWGSGQVEFDAEGVNRQFAGRNADTGLSALTVLAFLGAGYTHEKGPYQPQVQKALQWLIAQQDAEGSLAGNAEHYARMYCHGMATYALAEAYGMSRVESRDWMRPALEKAVAYIVDFQHPTDGGWRYEKGKMGDMSMFGWQLMALKSAEINGIPVPQRTRSLMQRFLQTHSLGTFGGLASYRPGDKISAAMTAEALYCKQMLGMAGNLSEKQEAAAYLIANIPKRSQMNLYYWYYGTLAMRNHGGDEWNQWNTQVRELLIQEQRKDGALAGSWDPDGPWGPYGGRLYSTTLSTLTLEVYYRFLPLYNLGQGEGLK